MGFDRVNATLEECAAVCLGFTCDMYTKESCSLVQNEYGCDCPGCHCDADLVYSDMRRGLRSNYTYYDDDGEAEEELIMVLCLIVFGTILAIGLTYIAMLTYRNYYYPPLPPKQHLDPQVVEFELVEKGEGVKETDDPY